MGDPNRIGWERVRAGKRQNTTLPSTAPTTHCHTTDTSGAANVLGADDPLRLREPQGL